MNNASNPKDGDRGGGRKFVSNFVMQARIRGEFSAEQLQEALLRLRPRHSQLIPAAAEADPAVSRFGLRVLSGCKDDDWTSVVKEELRTPFPDDPGPFARFTLLRMGECSDLVGTFHHGRCDGMSGVYVLRDVLRLLGEPSVALPALPPPPDFLAVIPAAVKENPLTRLQLEIKILQLRLAFMIRQMRKRPSPETSTPASPAGKPEPGLPPSQRFCIRTAALTEAQTATLAARCKSEGTTVHAAVCAAWLRAFAGMQNGRNGWSRGASSPVNLRQRTTPPVADTAGMFMAMVETRIDCSPQRDFWRTARQFKRKLTRASSDKNLFMFPLLLRKIFSRLPPGQLKEIIPFFFDRPVKYDFSITNLGRLDIPARIGGLTVTAFHNLVNSSEHERTVGVNSLDGRMTFSFTFRESKMDPQEAENLLQSAIRLLAEAVGW